MYSYKKDGDRIVALMESSIVPDGFIECSKEDYNKYLEDASAKHPVKHEPTYREILEDYILDLEYRVSLIELGA